MRKPLIKAQSIERCPTAKITKQTIEGNVLTVSLAFPITDGILKRANGKIRKSHIKEYGKITNLELEAVLLEDGIYRNLHLTARIFTKNN